MLKLHSHFSLPPRSSPVTIGQVPRWLLDEAHDAASLRTNPGEYYNQICIFL